jgi:tRNA(Ile)-lysidine synthase TilS/MesJ
MNASTPSPGPVFYETAQGYCVEYPHRRCSICILPDIFPDADLHPVTGECQFCRNHQPPRAENWLPMAIDAASATGQPPRCLMLYSGGKDSTHALHQLVTVYQWQVTAFTYDNGFLAKTAHENISRVCDALGVESVVGRLTKSDTRKIYQFSLTEPFGPETTKYSTSACGACISTVFLLAGRAAQARNIPLLCGGWTPGQFTEHGFIQGDFLIKVIKHHYDVISEKIELESVPHVALDVFPPLFNPLYLQPYDEERVLDRCREIGWSAPANTDSCSTNCTLNGFLVINHILRYGYHPYEYELAHHVRLNAISRTEALEKITNINVQGPQIQRIARSLGVEPFMFQ